MKIAVLGTRGFPGVQGGVEAHCENLYPRLAARGCEVVVFTRAQYVDPSIKEFEGVKFIPLTCPSNKFLEAFVHTFKGVLAAIRLKPDIVHIHASGPSLCVPMVRMLGMKAVMTSHGPEHLRKKWAGLPKYILMIGEYLGVTWANGVISVSKANAERLRKNFKRDISDIPNGVIIPEAAKTREALDKYGLGVGKYILAVGRFVPEKGFHDLIARTFPGGWKLVIAGKSDHEDKYSLDLKRKAAENPNIVLTGFITGKTLQELYSHAGLFVLPSYYEGLPIALLEAMSYRLSCIVSDIPANREVGLSEERYFMAGDVEGLFLRMNDFIAKPMTEEEKSRQIELLKQKYDWDKIAEETLKVYQEIGEVGISNG
ncbi:MAG: glycosyltransferase family 4 protein [Candidatus Omnitrophota bacterium]|jgi:glycosyltransferase involved in cell wall biosynthesis